MRQNSDCIDISYIDDDISQGNLSNNFIHKIKTPREIQRPDLAT